LGIVFLGVDGRRRRRRRRRKERHLEAIPIFSKKLENISFSFYIDL